MDDDIEIEEHDIFEHPQVKAVFKDLTKIEIQLHTGAFYDSPPRNEELSNLLVERQDFEDNGFTEEFPAQFEESDGEQVATENIGYESQDNKANVLMYADREGNVKTVNSLINSQVVATDHVVHEISDDEANDTVDKDYLKARDAENENGLRETELRVANGLNSAINSDEVVEISDDEEPTKLADENTQSIHLNTDIDTVLANGRNIYLGTKVATVIEDVIDKVYYDKRKDSTMIHDGKEILSELENVIENTSKIDDNESLITGDLNEDNTNSEDITMVEEPANSISNGNLCAEPYDSTENDLTIPIKEEFDEVPIKDEIIDDFDTEDYNFDDTASQIEANLEVSSTFNEPVSYLPNKIILGSKPSPSLVSNVKETSLAVVVLKDWSKYLKESQSFCYDCKILFPIPNDLDYHKMSHHSLLAPIPSANRAVKSTAKSAKPKNMAKKSTSSVDIANSTHCSHCNVNFKDNTALIKHLYELLPQKYDCQKCNESFNSQNDLVNHNAMHVKPEPRKILKAKKNLGKPTILKSLLIQNAVTPVKNEVVPVIKTEIKEEPHEDSCKYKCMVCNQILNSNYASRKHQKLLHPGKKHKFIFKKIIKLNRSKDKLVFEDDKPKSKKMKLDNFKDIELIPISALFQCPKCNLHFTSNLGGVSHMSFNNCDTNLKKINCTICKKKIRYIDKEIHSKQHKISSKFKIYKITKTGNERTLCKCLICNVHYEFMFLKRHMTYNNCGKIATAKCPKCNILLSKDRLPAHMAKHNTSKLKPKDFIIVEYAPINRNTNEILVTTKPKTASKTSTVKPLVLKTQPGVKLEQTMLETVSKINAKYLRYFVCKHCKMCKRTLHNAHEHLSKACVNNDKIIMITCKKCGVLLSTKAIKDHSYQHSQYKFTVKDLQFFDLATRKRMQTPVFKYFACKKCKIHFYSKFLQRKHICGEDYENCEFCGDRFENNTLKLHREFHIARQPKNKPRPVVNPKISEDSDQSVIPELMLRYESLNPIWNILYSCKACEIVSDLYNKAVEHSQGHLRKEKLCSNYTKCLICNLNFDETCWPKHKELHSQMSIKRKVFKVLTYSPENLLDESWFKMFESLPEKKIRQIIDQSVFGSERSLKMKLIKYGLPEFTLYCCSYCKVCFENSSLTTHVNEKCNSSKFICKECDIAFENASTLTFHALLHEKGIKKEEFRIIHFIKTPRKSKDNTNSIESDDSKQSSSEKQFIQNANPKVLALFKNVRERIRTEDIDFAEPISNNPRATYDLHRCVRCSMSLQFYKYKLKYHRCVPLAKQFYCVICKQNFIASTKVAHHGKHVEDPEFRASNINVYEFDPVHVAKDNPKKKKKGKVISTKIKPRKASKKTYTRSVKLKHDSDAILETDDSDSIANTDSRPNSSASTSKNAQNKNTAKIFKCECGLHFLSMKSINEHIKICSSKPDVSQESCSKCNLLFPTDVLVTHLCKHHTNHTKIIVEMVKNTKLAVNDLKIKKTDETHSKLSTDSEASSKRTIIKINSTELGDPNTLTQDYIKLYKCGDCNVHYLNQNTCYKHAYKNHVKLDPRQFIDCKMCGLAFTLHALQNHIRRHHSIEFNLDKVLIEEYQPGLGNGVLKIDIHLATQKVQNVQVSSSND